jgi:hypothetical protein
MNPVTESTATLDRPARTEDDRHRHTESARRLWQCVCGEVYRVWGSGRHRIYWPLDAPRDAPVIDGCCVRCRRALPGKQPHCSRSPEATVVR